MTEDGLSTLKWGTDYLLRTFAKTTKTGQTYPEYFIAYQVRAHARNTLTSQAVCSCLIV
jgi:hypothetical protein